MADAKKPAAKKPAAKKPAAKKSRESPVQKKPRESPVSKPPENDQAPAEIKQAAEGSTGEDSIDESGQSAEGLSEYKPKQHPLKAAGLDQHAEHAKRKAERDAEREEHNQRTGDISRQGWNH